MQLATFQLILITKTQLITIVHLHLPSHSFTCPSRPNKGFKQTMILSVNMATKTYHAETGQTIPVGTFAIVLCRYKDNSKDNSKIILKLKIIQMCNSYSYIAQVCDCGQHNYGHSIMDRCTGNVLMSILQSTLEIT